MLSNELQQALEILSDENPLMVEIIVVFYETKVQ